LSNHSINAEIFPTLSTIIVEALRIDPAKITMAARLFDDLGAESIDLLDIRFRLEHAFGFKIEQEEIIRNLGEELSAGQIREKLTVGSLTEYISNRLQQPAKAA
jgi:acyl carrier protein